MCIRRGMTSNILLRRDFHHEILYTSKSSCGQCKNDDKKYKASDGICHVFFSNYDLIY